jgi:hypothetical protein
MSNLPLKISEITNIPLMNFIITNLPPTSYIITNLPPIKLKLFPPLLRPIESFALGLLAFVYYIYTQLFLQIQAFCLKACPCIV